MTKNLLQLLSSLRNKRSTTFIYFRALLIQKGYMYIDTNQIHLEWG